MMSKYQDNLETKLRMVRRSGKAFSTEELQSLAYHMATALAYIHGLKHIDGVPLDQPYAVHGNLKPTNVLFDADGPFLTDGVVYPASNPYFSSPYAAPETVMQGILTPASDMWSLGAMLCELATSVKLVVDSRNWQSFTLEWEPALDSVVDPKIQSIIKTLLVINPSDRITAKELVDLLSPTADPAIVQVAMEIKLLRQIQARMKIMEKHIRNIKQFFRASGMSSIQRVIMDFMENTGVTQLMAHASNTDAPPLQVPNRVKLRYSQQDSAEAAALMYAALSGNVQMVQFLVPHEAIHKTYRGMTALMVANAADNVEIVRLLIGSEVKQQDNNGNTALMFAAENNNLQAVELLLLHEKRMRNNSGWTALMHAAANGHTQMVKLLAEHESQLTNSANEMAIHIAEKNGFEAVMYELHMYEGEKSGVRSLAYQIQELENLVSKMESSHSDAITQKENEIKELEMVIKKDYTGVCIVCMGNPRSILIEPCNHVCICESCYEKLPGKRAPFAARI